MDTVFLDTFKFSPDARIAEVETRTLQKDRVHTDILAALRKDIEAMTIQLDRDKAAAHQELFAHEGTRAALLAESIARHTAEQQVADLKERLADNDAHRLSIEEKHQHSREALEHYRQSVKEQRDQDQRRHEQQIQQLQAEARQLQQSLAVKQDGITRLNQEGARLVADLSHAQTALYDQQAQSRKVDKKLATLQDASQQAKIVAAELAGKESQVNALKEKLEAAEGKSSELSIKVRELELALAAAHAKLESQQEIVTEVRAYLEARERPAQGSAD